jgi:hypothetical protein
MNSFASCFVSMHVAYLDIYITSRSDPAFIPLAEGSMRRRGRGRRKERHSSCQLGIGEERKEEEAGTCACEKSAEHRPTPGGAWGMKGQKVRREEGDGDHKDKKSPKLA